MRIRSWCSGSTIKHKPAQFSAQPPLVPISVQRRESSGGLRLLRTGVFSTNLKHSFPMLIYSESALSPTQMVSIAREASMLFATSSSISSMTCMVIKSPMKYRGISCMSLKNPMPQSCCSRVRKGVIMMSVSFRYRNGYGAVSRNQPIWRTWPSILA